RESYADLRGSRRSGWSVDGVVGSGEVHRQGDDSAIHDHLTGVDLRLSVGHIDDAIQGPIRGTDLQAGMAGTTVGEEKEPVALEGGRPGDIRRNLNRPRSNDGPILQCDVAAARWPYVHVPLDEVQTLGEGVGSSIQAMRMEVVLGRAGGYGSFTPRCVRVDTPVVGDRV